MESKEIVEQNFRKEFSELLKKYNAEFDVEVEMHDFGVNVSGISIYIPIKYNSHGVVSEATTIQLTKWFDYEL